jgi:hypothetical protein
MRGKGRCGNVVAYNLLLLTIVASLQFGQNECSAFDSFIQGKEAVAGVSASDPIGSVGEGKPHRGKAVTA